MKLVATQATSQVLFGIIVTRIALLYKYHCCVRMYVPDKTAHASIEIIASSLWNKVKSLMTLLTANSI